MSENPADGDQTSQADPLAALTANLSETARILFSSRGVHDTLEQVVAVADHLFSEAVVFAYLDDSVAFEEVRPAVAEPTKGQFAAAAHARDHCCLRRFPRTRI